MKKITIHLFSGSTVDLNRLSSSLVQECLIKTLDRSWGIKKYSVDDIPSNEYNVLHLIKTNK